jgi:hypothetical protein
MKIENFSSFRGFFTPDYQAVNRKVVDKQNARSENEIEEIILLAKKRIPQEDYSGLNNNYANRGSSVEV